MSSSINLIDRDKSVVTINVNIGYEIIIPVTINYDTGLLFTLAEQLCGEETLDMKLILPNFDEFATTLYTYFISGKNMTDVYVTDRQTMIKCLSIYDLVGDTNFFNWLLTSLFKLWTVLSPIMYSNQVSEEVRWDLWLRCPHQLLPDYHVADPDFQKVWLRRDNNKSVTINDNEHFFYEVIITSTETGTDDNDGDDIITTTKTIKTTGYDRPNTKISNNYVQEKRNGQTTIIDYNTTFNDVKHGITNTEYCDGEYFYPGVEIYHCVNGMEYGPYNTYIEGKLQSQYYNINGHKQGLLTKYFVENVNNSINEKRIACERHYKDGRCHGEEIGYCNTTSTPRKKFVNEWDHGQCVTHTQYYPCHTRIKTTYKADGIIHILPVSYEFYTVTNIHENNNNYKEDKEEKKTLTRKITNPIDDKLTKHDIYYHSDGNIIKDNTYPDSWVYNISDRSWCNKQID